MSRMKSKCKLDSSKLLALSTPAPVEMHGMVTSDLHAEIY